MLKIQDILKIHEIQEQKLTLSKKDLILCQAERFKLDKLNEFKLFTVFDPFYNFKKFCQDNNFDLLVVNNQKEMVKKTLSKPYIYCIYVNNEADIEGAKNYI